MGGGSRVRIADAAEFGCAAFCTASGSWEEGAETGPRLVCVVSRSTVSKRQSEAAAAMLPASPRRWHCCVVFVLYCVVVGLS